MSNGYEILKKCHMVTKAKRMRCTEYEVRDGKISDAHKLYTGKTQ